MTRDSCGINTKNPRMRNTTPSHSPDDCSLCTAIPEKPKIQNVNSITVKKTQINAYAQNLIIGKYFQLVVLVGGKDSFTIQNI